MNPRRCLWSILVAALWLALGNRGAGQSDESKPRVPRADDVRPKISSPEASLSQRLGNRELSERESSIAKILKSLNGKDKEAIVKSIKENPEFLKRLEEELRNNKDFRDKLAGSVDQQSLTDEQKKLLNKAIGKEEKPPDTNPTGTETTPRPIVPTPMTEPTPKTSPDPVSPPTEKSEAKPEPAKATEPSGLKKLLTQALPKAADLMTKLGLADDADFLRALMRGTVPDDNNGYLAQVARKGMAVAKELPLDKMLSGDFASVVGNWHLPPLPDIHLPFGGDSHPDSGSSSSSPGVSAEGTGMAFFWVLVLIVLALFLWKGKELFIPSAKKPAGDWKLGPWPVRPEGVRTRSDLIKAFEYLAFLVLGLAAQPRNHLELASNLAATGNEPGSPAAADRLARLYERARYAPTEEALPDDELRAARHDLAFLAGVGRA